MTRAQRDRLLYVAAVCALLGAVAGELGLLVLRAARAAGRA